MSPLADDGVFGEQTFAAVQTFQSAHSLPITGVVDDATQNEITKTICSQLVSPNAGPTPWLTWMKSHIGESENTGGVATPFDEEVFSHTSYGDLDGVMEPGCAATACAALEESGYNSPHHAAAESFRGFGIPHGLEPGAIVGFNWKGKKGVHCDHVTFCDHIVSDTLVACLGGNQGHEVKVSIFSRANIDFVRWPVETLAKVVQIVTPDPSTPVEKIEPVSVKTED